MFHLDLTGLVKGQSESSQRAVNTVRISQVLGNSVRLGPLFEPSQRAVRDKSETSQGEVRNQSESSQTVRTKTLTLTLTPYLP